jgi:RNA polymerase sigma-70 factor (ECF subfamily)
LHYLKEVEVARDTAQETFVRVYTASARFDVRRKFRPWVLCIARNLCLNELKRKKTVSMEAFEEYASSARDGSGEVFRYSGDGPDEALMAQERRELLERALNALDDGARELVMMRFFERLSAKDIAEVVGSTEGAVRTRLHRVLSGMRTQYRAQSEDL